MRRDFDFALLIGGLLGFVFACLVIFLPFAGLSDFVYRWQTLIAGLAAIVAAAIALWAVRQQIRHAQEIEDERRERRMYAARAMMPQALASICEYARECCEFYRENLPMPNFRPELGHQLDSRYGGIPPTPQSSTMILTELLEHGPSELQDIISDLVSHLQVQSSRANTFQVGRSISGAWFYTLIADALEIYARSNKMLDFARRDTKHLRATIGEADLLDAAQFCGFYEGEWLLLYAKLRDARPN